MAEPDNPAADMPPPGDTPPPRRRTLSGTLTALVRTRVSAGLITILPVVITIWLVRLIFDLIVSSSQWIVELFLLRTEAGNAMLKAWEFPFDRWDRITSELAQQGLNPEPGQFINLLPTHVQWIIPILAVMLTFTVLYAIGLLTANLIGRRLLETAEKLVDRVPMVKTVYRGIKQILVSLAGGQTQNFQRVALIPFPQERMRCVGFITSTFRDSLTEEELATVFIPTTPNPTTGYLQILRRRELVELDWNVEEAVRTIMSGGILRPDFLTIVPTGEMHKYEAAYRLKTGQPPPKLPPVPVNPAGPAASDDARTTE